MMSKGPIRQKYCDHKRKDSIRLRADWLPLTLALNYFLSIFPKYRVVPLCLLSERKKSEDAFKERKTMPNKAHYHSSGQKTCLSSQTQFSTWSSYSGAAEAERKGEELKPTAGQKPSTLWVASGILRWPQDHASSFISQTSSYTAAVVV